MGQPARRIQPFFLPGSINEHWCSGKFGAGERSGFFFPSLPLNVGPLNPLLPSLPLKVGPLNPARGSGGAL